MAHLCHLCAWETNDSGCQTFWIHHYLSNTPASSLLGRKHVNPEVTKCNSLSWKITAWCTVLCRWWLYCYFFFLSPFTDVNTWWMVSKNLLHLQLKARGKGCASPIGVLAAQHSPLRAQLYACQLLGAEAREQGHTTKVHTSKREVDGHSTCLFSLSNPTSKSQPFTFGET